MDTLFLARFQFAFTIMYHYIYPVLSIGLGLIMVIMEAIYLKTGNEAYLRMTKFWTKIFALTFAMGVATGIVMEFEFGTNWSTYSRYVGDVFGSALAAEGVFAFFLESGFLALLLFGWNRIGKKLHFFSTLMVCLGSHFSAIWIVVANSWMQTPAGFHIVGSGMTARAEITDFWTMALNPSSVDRLIHVLLGAWLAGAFLVVSISAFYLLKQRHQDFARRSIVIGLWVGLITCLLQAYSGDRSGKVVAQHQPTKLAAFEGLFETQKGAPLTLFGVVDEKNEKLNYAIQVPKLLSFLSYNNTEAEVKGLKEWPREDWPKTAVIFPVFRLMIGMWFLMLLFSLIALFLLHKGTLEKHRWVLRGLVLSVVFPQIANQAGWYVAETGRFPWIVYGLLRISDGLSKAVTANQILGSIILFLVVYTLLFVLFIYLLNEKVKFGPGDITPDSHYHGLHKLVEEEVPNDSHA